MKLLAIAIFYSTYFWLAYRYVGRDIYFDLCVAIIILIAAAALAAKYGGLIE